MRNNMLWKKGLVIGIIVLFIGISVIPSTGKTDVTTSGTTIYDGSLSGYVNDTSMNPIEGARVRVFFHETYEEDYSDEDGYYHVTNIPICYCLKNATCSKEGYKTEWVLLSIVEDTTHDFILTSNNQPPNKPSIHGPPSGMVGKPYEFFFSAVDPDGDNVSFYIEWGDGTSTGWTHFYPPGMDCSCSHAWFKMVRHTLRAKAKDIHGNESDWGRMSIRIPRNKAFNFNFNLLESLFELFPNLFPMLRHLVRV